MKLAVLLTAVCLSSVAHAADDASTEAAAVAVEPDTTRLYAALTLGLTSVPYDSEFGVMAGGRMSKHFGIEGMLRTEALSAFWAGTWWNAALGARLTPTSPAHTIRPTFGLSYGAGGLTNKLTTAGSPENTTVAGIPTTVPTKVSWTRHVTYGRVDLDAGVRWQRPGTRAYIQAVLGVYNVPASKATDEFISRDTLDAGEQFLDNAFDGVEGAGYSHWFEPGYSTVYIKLMMGLDLL